LAARGAPGEIAARPPACGTRRYSRRAAGVSVLRACHRAPGPAFCLGLHLTCRCHGQAGIPLRQHRGTALAMTAKPQGLRGTCKKLVASAALSLCL